MPLTDKERAGILDRLDNVCREAGERQDRIRREMGERARRDMPDRGRQPERRKKTRKTKSRGREEEFGYPVVDAPGGLRRSILGA